MCAQHTPCTGQLQTWDGRKQFVLGLALGDSKLEVGHVLPTSICQWPHNPMILLVT